MSADRDRAELSRLVLALAPYLDELVFVGGWAHRLHANHELARAPDFQPLATDDADVAAPLGLRATHGRIAELLQAAGFKEELRGDDRPPISEYLLGTDGAGLCVEFLSPQLGSGRHRDGTPDDTADVGGVTAQKLRYVELLLLEPWSVRLSDGNGYPLGAEGVRVRVANPACFIAQKLLAIDRRAPGKRPKDLLYVHDTALLFAPALDELRRCWERVRPDVSAAVSRKLGEQVEARLGRVDDLARKAAAIAAGTGRVAPPTPDRLLAVCRAAVREVFGL